MKKFLKDYLLKEKGIDQQYYYFEYSEDVNDDALSDAWLENRTPYIWKVAVLAAIDSNKCDFVHIVFGSMRSDEHAPEIKGYMYFDEGENDDIGRTINRATTMLKTIHPAFDND